MKYLLKDAAEPVTGTAVALDSRGNVNSIIQIDPGTATAYKVRLEGSIGGDMPFAPLGVSLTQDDPSLRNIATPSIIRAVVVSTDGALSVGIQE